MEIEEAVYSRLTTDPNVTALLGTRVYPAQAPQSGPWPILVYFQAHQVYLRTLTGRLKTNRFTMRLECMADTYSACKETTTAVQTSLLDGFSGDQGAGDLTVQLVLDEGADQDLEPPIHADEFGIYHGGLDLTIIWQKNT